MQIYFCSTRCRVVGIFSKIDPFYGNPDRMCHLNIITINDQTMKLLQMWLRMKMVIFV